MQWVEDVKMGLAHALYLCQKYFHVDEALQARERRWEKKLWFCQYGEFYISKKLH